VNEEKLFPELNKNYCFKEINLTHWSYGVLIESNHLKNHQMQAGNKKEEK
jgi:hypothetical protein